MLVSGRVRFQKKCPSSASSAVSIFYKIYSSQSQNKAPKLRRNLNPAWLTLPSMIGWIYVDILDGRIFRTDSEPEIISSFGIPRVSSEEIFSHHGSSHFVWWKKKPPESFFSASGSVRRNWNTRNGTHVEFSEPAKGHTSGAGEKCRGQRKPSRNSRVLFFGSEICTWIIAIASAGLKTEWSSPLDSITHEIKIYCAQECTEEQRHGHPLRVPPTAASQHGDAGGGLRTFAKGQRNGGEHSSAPTPPLINENPLPTHLEKN